MLKSSNIVNAVYSVIENANSGKGHEPHWLTAYQIIVRLGAKAVKFLIGRRVVIPGYNVCGIYRKKK